VAKGPQLVAIAFETVTNVCFRPRPDIKFVQTARQTGKAAKTANRDGKRLQTNKRHKTKSYQGQARDVSRAAHGDIKNNAGSTREIGAAFLTEGGIFLSCARTIHAAVQRNLAPILSPFFSRIGAVRRCRITPE
jgi:hypothetical protein